MTRKKPLRYGSGHQEQRIYRALLKAPGVEQSSQRCQWWPAATRNRVQQLANSPQKEQTGRTLDSQTSMWRHSKLMWPDSCLLEPSTQSRCLKWQHTRKWTPFVCLMTLLWNWEGTHCSFNWKTVYGLIRTFKYHRFFNWKETSVYWGTTRRLVKSRSNGNKIKTYKTMADLRTASLLCTRTEKCLTKRGTMLTILFGRKWFALEESVSISLRTNSQKFMKCLEIWKHANSCWLKWGMTQKSHLSTSYLLSSIKCGTSGHQLCQTYLKHKKC